MASLTSLFIDTSRRPASPWARLTTGGLLIALLSLLCWTTLASAAQQGSTFWKYREVFWQGWLLTLQIAILSFVGSTLLGLFAALGKRSPVLLIRYISIGYVELVRGMPLLVLILVTYFVFFQQVTQGRFYIGILALSLFSGAYMAEIFRAGIESVGASQRESARAIGLSPLQTYRLVIFPQALRHSLPAFTGQLASLIKDSSLLSVIGLAEYTYSAQQVFNTTYATIESFLPLALGYMILTIPISLWSKRLEKSLRYET